MATFVCSNIAVDEKMCEIEAILLEMGRGKTMEEFLRMDHAVVIETHTMIMMSKRCDYHASKATGNLAYEKLTTDTIKMLSYIEQIDVFMLTSPNISTKPKMRSNAVTCVCIFDAMSIVEFVHRATKLCLSKAILVHEGAITVTRAAVVAILFEKLTEYFGLTEKTELIMYTSDKRRRR